MVVYLNYKRFFPLKNTLIKINKSKSYGILIYCYEFGSSLGYLNRGANPKAIMKTHKHKR